MEQRLMPMLSVVNNNGRKHYASFPYELKKEYLSREYLPI